MPFDDAAADDRPRQLAARLHGAGRQARQRRRRVVGVDRRQVAAVPRVQCLEQIGRLSAAHLADDDVIGPVAQGMPHQVADRHVAAGGVPRLEPQAVRAAEPQLQRVLDRDDAAPGRQQRHQSIQQRRLPRAGASEIRTLRSLRSTAAAASTNGAESEPLAISSSVVKAGRRSGGS